LSASLVSEDDDEDVVLVEEVSDSELEVASDEDWLEEGSGLSLLDAFVVAELESALLSEDCLSSLELSKLLGRVVEEVTVVRVRVSLEEEGGVVVRV
jgi:hypothetical protein